jgi:hypothetical protein
MTFPRNQLITEEDMSHPSLQFDGIATLMLATRNFASLTAASRPPLHLSPDVRKQRIICLIEAALKLSEDDDDDEE